MPIYRKESLDTLRQKIDLVEVLSSHLELKRAGAAYKGLCPFHDEKTPSFMIQKGDTHYHCFGCGAHGDAIQFLMTYQKLSFHEAIETLAQRFGVPLEVVEGGEEYKGPSKALMRDALTLASRFFHFYLLHTDEGHLALQYLYERGIDLDFIRQFQIGLAPKGAGMLRKILHEKRISDDILIAVGLLSQTQDGRLRDFFSDRITFPIHAASGNVIGFSARKFKEETFGGKYVNTSETTLFKKSKVLFGLHHSRRRIAKERKALIVEGQIDALRLIREGFNYTVAGQGTAFGDGHAKELLNLGVETVFLALDADNAGKEAACKIGDLFQKEGVEVRVIALPPGSDPDSYLRQQGATAFEYLLEKSHDYLTFLVEHRARSINMASPAGKNQLVQQVSQQIRLWNQPLMVHESLRKLAHLAQVPENMIGVGQQFVPNLYIKKQESAGVQAIDPDRILELDFLRWLILMGPTVPELLTLAQANITPDALKNYGCRALYTLFLSHAQNGKQPDLLDLAADDVLQALLSELHQKKINSEKAAEQFPDSMQKILNRNWMQKREEVRLKIQGGGCSDDEVMVYVKQFDDLKRSPPALKMEPAILS